MWFLVWKAKPPLTQVVNCTYETLKSIVERYSMGKVWKAANNFCSAFPWNSGTKKKKSPSSTLVLWRHICLRCTVNETRRLLQIITNNFTAYMIFIAEVLLAYAGLKYVLNNYISNLTRLVQISPNSWVQHPIRLYYDNIQKANHNGSLNLRFK